MIFDRKGFSSLVIFTIVAVIIAAVFASGIVWFASTHSNPAPPSGGGPVACTAEAKLCPDGSYVGRTGPNCEFAACPVIATSTTGGRGEGAFCGGIATGAFPCDPGYSCKLDGTYPDAGGRCVKN